ncbi:MAG: 6,7-dimethyl-8-ribityllumazine synthase [Ignavibacteriales bacterium]|nr:6,7-dimethyl-8-ribityllumazine synthase [Ignavibacteriales bacterium]
MKIAIVVSRFNSGVTSKLLRGAEECLERRRAQRKHLAVFSCPGAFELPQVADKLAASGTWDAIVCLGAVIRGQTPHFDYVARGAAHGIQDVALKRGIPVIFGVLTTENEEQALARAGGNRGNKGWDAAEAAVDMVALFRTMKRSGKRR